MAMQVTTLFEPRDDTLTFSLERPTVKNKNKNKHWLQAFLPPTEFPKAFYRVTGGSSGGVERHVY